MSGYIDSIIDLNQPSNLQPFVDLIKSVTLDKRLIKEAASFGWPEPDLIRSVPKLISTLMDSNWRIFPMQFDVPFASQIFGQLVSNAGIEGILYKSKFSNKDCLAIFPQNFDDTNGSYVQLDDLATPETKVLRWDFNTWRLNNKN